MAGSYIIMIHKNFCLKIWLIIIDLDSHIYVWLNRKKNQTSFRGELNCGMESVYNKDQFLLLFTAGKGLQDVILCLKRGDSWHYVLQLIANVYEEHSMLQSMTE